MVKIAFNPNAPEIFLINGSMVGLGLILYIYSIAMPIIRNLLLRRTDKLKMLIRKRDEILEKMKIDKKNTQLTSENKTTQENIEATEQLPFHLDLGYIFSGTFFAGSLILSLLKITNPDSVYIAQLAEFSLLLFVLGITFFLVVWYLMFVEFRTYINEEFQKVKEEAQDKENTPQQRNLKTLLKK